MNWTIVDIKCYVLRPIEDAYETRHSTSLSLFTLHENNNIASLSLDQLMSGINLGEPDHEVEPMLVKWKEVPDSKKLEWSLRAKRLNERKTVGDFKSYIDNMDSSRLIALVEKDCSINFKTLRSSLKSSLTQVSKGDSKKIYHIPHPNALQLQSYRRLYANKIISEMILGLENCNVRENEIVVVSPNELVIHISSARRIARLMDVDGVNLVKIMDWEKSHYSQACGKVHFTDVDGKCGFGYILDESEDGLDLYDATEQDDLVKIKKPMFEGYAFGYEKTETVQSFSPVCLRFTENMFTFEFLSSRVVRIITSDKIIFSLSQ